MAYKPATLFFTSTVEAVDWYVDNCSQKPSADLIEAIIGDLIQWGLTRVCSVDSEGFCSTCDYELQIIFAGV